jgi:hypothetical protein
MARKLTSDESRETLLRTSADVAAHALVQLEILAKEWPEFTPDAKEYRVFVERLIESAKQYGYMEKTRI